MYSVCMHTHTRSACKAHTTPHTTEHYIESVPPHVQYSTNQHITPLPHGVAHHMHAFAHIYMHTPPLPGQVAGV